MSEQLEQLYQEAKAALKAKDYNRASDLLRQILLIDENYKDASRLLAQTVRLRRRRWYSHPVMWSTLGFVIVLGLGIWLAPKLRDMYASQPPTQIAIVPITRQPVAPHVTEIPVLAPQAAPVPLVWKRVSLGQDVRRDVITAIVVDPRDQDVIYVGTEHAGIYKSIDGAQSWRPFHGGLERAQVKEIVIDPLNPNILNVHTFPDQIYRSTDGGNSWTITLADLENYDSQDYYMAFFARKLIVDPHNGEHLILTDRNGWHESDDSGETWAYRDNNWGNCPALLGTVGFHPTEPRTLLLAQMGDDGDCKNGIYRWDGSGSSAPELVFRYDQHPDLDPDHHHVITDIQTSEAKEGSGYIYARTFHRGQVYGSVDGGLTWIGYIKSDANSTRSCPAFDVRPDGQGVGLCEWSFGFTIMTTYGGQDWKRLNSPFPVNDYHYLYPRVTAISAFPDQPQSILVGIHGISVTLDDTITWAEMSDGLPGISVDLQYSQPDSSLFLTEHTGCVGDERLLHSTDKGETWNPMTDIACGFALGADGIPIYRYFTNSLFTSRDGGVSWAKGARPTINSSQIVSLAAHPTQAGVAIAKIRTGADLDFTKLEFYATTDSGSTWQKQGEISEISGSEDALFYAPGPGDVIYSIGAMSNVARFRDGEVQWTACAPIDAISPNSANTLAIDPGDANKIYLATLGTGIQHSEDGCESWKPTNDGLGSLFANTLALDPNDPDTIYAGTDGGAYVSFDFGATWSQINDGLLGATVVYSIVVDKEGDVYAATPYGIFKLESQ